MTKAYTTKHQTLQNFVLIPKIYDQTLQNSVLIPKIYDQLTSLPPVNKYASANTNLEINKDTIAFA